MFLIGSLLFGALIVAVSPPKKANAADTSMELVGPWQPQGIIQGNPDPPRIAVEAGSRRIYVYQEVFPTTWVGTYDADTLAPLGAPVELPGFDADVIYPDADTGDLFIGERVPVSAGAGSLVTTKHAVLGRFSLRDGKVQQISTLDLTPTFGSDAAIVAAYRTPGSPLLWVVGTTDDGQVHKQDGVQVAELDTRQLDNPTAAIHWSTDLTSDCPRPMHGNPRENAGLGYFAPKGALYLACGNRGRPDLFQLPDQAGMGRLELKGDPNVRTEPGIFTKFPRASDFTRADSLYDAGSGRMMFQSNVSSQGGVTFYGFDATSDSFVGGFSGGTQPYDSVGIDPIAGRVYGLTVNPDYGLAAADVRPSPVANPRLFPQYNKFNDHNPFLAPIAVDPITHRLFLSYASESALLIVRDTAPPYLAPPTGHPDDNTTDIDEVPGQTVANYSGSAQGFGSRYRSIGGAQSLVYNLSSGTANVGDGQDTEFRAAYLDVLALANSSAVAGSTAAYGDEVSGQSGWPYTPARCDSSGKLNRSDVLGATAECSGDDSFVTTSAELDDSGGNGITVQRSSMTGRIHRDPIRGLVATVTSEAKGVSVLVNGTEALRIGDVTVTAEAWAHGRPGTAGTSFERVVRNVEQGGAVACADVCTLDNLNNLSHEFANSRVRLEFPEPDAQAKAGTPGGYQAAIRRGLAEQLEEQSLNHQPVDRIEVPGAVITMYTDSYRTSRTVVELAATEADVHYGISSESGDFGPGGVNPDFASLAAGGGNDGGQSPLPGLDSGGGGANEPAIGAAGVPVGGSPRFVSQLAHLGWNGVNGLLKLLPVWVLLIAPVYLSARRWLLIRSQAFPGGQP